MAATTDDGGTVTVNNSGTIMTGADYGSAIMAPSIGGGGGSGGGAAGPIAIGGGVLAEIPSIGSEFTINPAQMKQHEICDDNHRRAGQAICSA